MPLGMQMKENNETKIGVIDPYWDEIELKIHIDQACISM